MAVMTNKNEMNCVLDFLNELKTNIHWDNTRIKYIDIAIEAVERDIKEFDFTHKMIICPQCGYYLIEDLINDKGKIYDQGFKDGIKYALNHTELD